MLKERKRLLARREGLVRSARSHIHPTGVSSAGVALIASFEGFVDHVYRDVVGVETIAYGETRPDIIRKYRVRKISQHEGLQLLKQRLDNDYYPHVKSLPVYKHLNQHQVDALTSFAYNVGSVPLAPGSSLGNALRQSSGWERAAADALLLYVKGGGQTLPGLVRRRRAERSLFLR
jgi:lysozyme